MAIEKVYRQADIDKNVEEVLGYINELVSTDIIPYTIYCELFDLTANITNVNTCLVKNENLREVKRV